MIFAKGDISGLLIDLDGVIYQDNELIDGALNTINYLKQHSIPFRFLTNATIKTRNEICKQLADLGIEVSISSIFSALFAAELYLTEQKFKNVFALLPANVLTDFPFKYDETKEVDCVIVGDYGKQFTFDILDNAFRFILGGAELVAAHKNKYWRNNNKLQLDGGPFVSLLEYACDTKAKLIGKPAFTFFEMAIKNMGLEPEQILMVGDDINTDILGGQNAGVRTAMVKTGKFRESDLKQDITPDFVINSIKDIPNFFD